MKLWRRREKWTLKAYVGGADVLSTLSRLCAHTHSYLLCAVWIISLFPTQSLCPKWEYLNYTLNVHFPLPILIVCIMLWVVLWQSGNISDSSFMHKLSFICPMFDIILLPYSCTWFRSLYVLDYSYPFLFFWGYFLVYWLPRVVISSVGFGHILLYKQDHSKVIASFGVFS